VRGLNEVIIEGFLSVIRLKNKTATRTKLLDTLCVLRPVLETGKGLA
jgi:hypothetical protein